MARRSTPDPLGDSEPMIYVPHGSWRHLGLSTRFYLFLVLGIGVVLAGCWVYVLWRRPDILPLFLSWYLPLGLTVFGFSVALILLARWIASRFE